MKSFFIIGIILAMLGFSVYIMEMNKIANATMHNETVSCYDKEDNIINNVNCTKEVYDNQNYNDFRGMIYGMSVLIFFIVGFLGILLIIFGLLDYIGVFK